MVSFEVESGRLVVSDPCYDKETWCGAYGLPAQNGKWVGFATYSDEGDWGIRVECITAHVRGLKPEYLNWTKLTQEFGVDSGQMSIVDERYYPEEPGEDDKFYAGGWGATLSDVCFGAVTAKRIRPDQLDMVERIKVHEGKDFNEEIWQVDHRCGVVSSTGYGDGGYIGEGVYGAHDELVAVRVIFLNEQKYGYQVEDESYDDEDTEVDFEAEN